MAKYKIGAKFTDKIVRLTAECPDKTKALGTW